MKFVDGLGVTGESGAGSGSMLVAWGRENVDALLAMSDLGHLVHNAALTGAEGVRVEGTVRGQGEKNEID